jgi:hypothetical protein
MIHVARVIFLQTDLGAWLRVEALEGQYSIPHEHERLIGFAGFHTTVGERDECTGAVPFSS